MTAADDSASRAASLHGSAAFEVEVAGEPVSVPPDGWVVKWLDQRRGIARLERDGGWLTVLVEGNGSDWVVTIRGRRLPVTVRTRRERLLSADVAGATAAGPAVVKATLPGLVVGVAVAEGDEVEEGAALVTIEAMKMQNEVRAPRAGRVAGISISAGRTVRSGEPLLRIE